MPIKPELRWLYPIDWRELSAAIRFGRAAGRCEGCRRPHGAWVWHLGDGRWWDETAATWRDGRGRALAGSGPAPTLAGAPPYRLRRTRVVLAAAHRDHDPTHNRPTNLVALCQRCHLNHDRTGHLRRRRLAHMARYALGDLFLGAYRPAWRWG